VLPVKYELGFYIPEDDILHSHRRENLKSYSVKTTFVRTGVSERRMVSFIRLKRISELELTLVVASNLSTLRRNTDL
jgi:hypothetical protein